MKIIDCVQGSEEWFKARCGIPTASEFDKIITTEGKASKQREKYMYRLAGEAIIGKPEETYKNGNMERGTLLEDEARQAYSLISGNEVIQVGFCDSESGYGASPDGLIGNDGLLEIKCPTLAVHVSYLLGNKLPTDYFQQVQGELLVTGRKWADFVSYYPGIKPLIVRVKRDEDFIERLRVELEVFYVELTEVVKMLGGK